MDLLETMHTYFRGERMLGLALPVLGLALLVAAFWVHRTQAGAFAWSLLIPLAIVGVVAVVAGPLFVLRTDGQIEALERSFEEDRAGTIASERARMAKVDANWPRLKVGWGVVTLAALVLLLAVKRDWATGLGLALVLIGALLFFVDVFAERRAAPYSAALQAASSE